jgi:hypothetical protein
MPYELSLEPDLDRGGSRYRAVLDGELEPDAVRRLSEWLADAKQNPEASFVIDVSGATGSSRRARLELRALLRRHRELETQRRLSIVAPPRARRRAVAGSAAVALLLDGLMSTGPPPLPL